jgi:hypothetical protein
VRFVVDAIVLESPDDECALIGVDVPDFGIAALAIGIELPLEVVRSGGARPDFNDER